MVAERLLAAAEANLGITRRNRFPDITLTGAAGTATNALRSLVDGDFSIWSLLANVTAPLWQGGRLREEVNRAEAESEEALATFANSVLTAYAEVETALAADEFLQRRERHLGAAVEQAQAAAVLANERYITGLDTYITVLDSQRSAFQAEGELIAARRQRLDNRGGPLPGAGRRLRAARLAVQPGRPRGRRRLGVRKARTARLGGSGAGRRGPRKRTPGVRGKAPSD